MSEECSCFLFLLIASTSTQVNFRCNKFDNGSLYRKVLIIVENPTSYMYKVRKKYVRTQICIEVTKCNLTF